MTSRTVPLAAMERLLKAAGAVRVGEDAKAALKEALEDYAELLGKHACSLAIHAGRKTVQGSDVKLALRQLSKE